MHGINKTNNFAKSLFKTGFKLEKFGADIFEI